MNPLTIIAIVLGVILVALIILSLVGKKLQKKSDAAQANITAGAQYYSIMVIDKKRMKLSEAGFPQVVLDQTPKYLRRAKVPVVKAKIGPKVASLMCEEKIFDLIPVKKEVKAVVSGIYVLDVKGLHGKNQTVEAVDANTTILSVEIMDISLNICLNRIWIDITYMKEHGGRLNQV